MTRITAASFSAVVTGPHGDKVIPCNVTDDGIVRFALRERGSVGKPLPKCDPTTLRVVTRGSVDSVRSMVGTFRTGSGSVTAHPTLADVQSAGNWRVKVRSLKDLILKSALSLGTDEERMALWTKVCDAYDVAADAR